MQKREEVMASIEEADMKMRKNGYAEAWYEGCDATVHDLSSEVNGELFQQLARSCGLNADCVNHFREGIIVLMIILQLPFPFVT